MQCKRERQILYSKMNIFRKPLLLFLSFTTLLLSPSSQLLASCDSSQSSTSAMPCASKAVNTCEQARLELKGSACCCKFSKGSSPVIPIATSIKVIEGDLKLKELRILKANSFFKSDLTGKGSIHSSYDFFFQPKFLSNLKIYSIISSYLI